MEYPPETRAAVLAAVASGQSVNSIAKQYGISHAAIRRWRDIALAPPIGAQQKKQAIGEQVYGLLEDSIETLRVQVRAMRDEEWIKKQSAADLAILHGVLHDKARNVLAAFRPTAEGAGDE